MIRQAILLSLILGMPGSCLPGEDLEFALPSTNGNVVTFNDATIEKGAVICFLGNECPLAKLYSARLAEMSEKFESQGIRFLGINSNQQDSMEELKSFKSNMKIPFPLLKDYDNKIADQFDAKRTPEVFLLNRNSTVVYQGAIDDQYSPGVVREKAKRHYLMQAIEQLLAEKPISTAATEPEGCLIGRVKNPVKNPTVTYTNQIVRIFQDNCVECHRKDQIGPFALEEYEEAKGWAEMIVEVVDNGRMPPWHATDKHLEFTNARYLSESAKQSLRDWLAQGTPYGESSELPEKKRFTSGWQLPKEPDLVVEMSKRPYRVPANGTVEYQYFVVDPKFKEDKWVTAASVQPGNQSIVHHSIVFVRPPDGENFEGIGWLTAFVPGTANTTHNPNHARFIPAGSKLVFQQHYTPNGTAATDITRVGLVFGKPNEITHKVITLAALNQEFEIPASASQHVVESKLPFIPSSGKLLSFAPHMHYRGKSFQTFARTDASEVKNQLIDVPNYDFNWQHNYELKQPMLLDRVDSISCRFTFDNSEGNPFNPDSSHRVFWGDQTWEEMAVAFFHIAQPRTAKTPEFVSQKDEASNDSELETRAQKFVDQYFEKFDSNGDGVLVRDETPHAIQHFRFYRYDADRNGTLSRDEILAIARERFK